MSEGPLLGNIAISQGGGEMNASQILVKFMKIARRVVNERHREIINGITAAAAFMVLGGIGAKPLSNVAGFLYPLYYSFKALQSESKEDDTFWLTYWVVYGFCGMFESIASRFINWLPMYYPAKTLLLIWAYLPQTQGARKIYLNLILPLLHKYQPMIDKTHDDVYSKARELAGDVFNGAQRVQQSLITPTPQPASGKSRSYRARLEGEAPASHGVGGESYASNRQSPATPEPDGHGESDAANHDE